MSRRYEREREVAIQAVREAARLCRAVAAEISPEVLAKKDKSPVTVADFGSQALICRTLAEAFPDDPVIAEEDSAELRRPENAAILEQVLRHVRGPIRTDGAGGARSTPARSADGSTGAARASTATGSGRSTRSTAPRGSSAASSTPLRWRSSSTGRSRSRRWRVRTCRCTAGAEPRGSRRHLHAVRGEGAFVVPLEQRAEAGTRRSAPIRVSDRDDPAAVRFCESVESGHSAQGDAAAIAARLGITAPPLRMDSQAKYAVVARGEAEIYLRLPDPRRLPREDLGPRRRGLDRRRGRRDRHRHHGPAARVPPRPRAEPPTAA